MRHFVFIESNTSGTGLTFIHRAKSLGLAPVLLSSDHSRYHFEFEGLRKIEGPVHDLRWIVDTCRSLGDVVGCWSSSEYFIETSAKVARRLLLPGPDPQATRRARSKAVQRTLLRSGGMPTPRWQEIRSRDDLYAAFEVVGWPHVLKPVAASGSVGVRLCSTAEESETHLQRLRAAGYPVALAEEFLRGPEYSVEVFDGVAVGVTAKHLGPIPAFVETGHDYPVVNASIVPRLMRSGEQACEVLGLQWGPIHIEMKIVPDGQAVVIEANPRLAGGFIPRLVEKASDHDLITRTIVRAIGGSYNPARDRGWFASIRFIIPEGAGFVRSIEFPSAEPSDDLEVMTYCHHRQPSRKRYGDFRDRVGHVLAAASHASAARQLAEEVMSKTKCNLTADVEGGVL